MRRAAQPIAPYREPMRRDPGGWTIEDDPVAEEALRSVEALGMILAEVLFHRLSAYGLDPTDHDLDLSLRALGSVAGRNAMTRLTWQTGIDEQGIERDAWADNGEALAAGERMRAILNWLFVWDLSEPDAPPALRPPSVPKPSVRLALQELWASLVYLDRRSKNQGTTGGGRRRSMVRTTTRSLD